MGASNMITAGTASVSATGTAGETTTVNVNTTIANAI